uniref:Coiled-coil domain-containing protein 22 homolog n=1 Tax=Paramoeba aestuarina TaxID=180227 RepID=A0A7S4NKW6_9EUKA|mmetsp:Transcript_18716/g.29349  ORF Transcript_18716/g.29349 Transcript_18716/m.29349 type:complete len:620 (+) Transcript_18716:188-2047(+)|eukprot:CAMPEP_0201511850 /NCGR_PEP_ID=MMETSP0161_2-20130828/4228_1 /ASSEMBLY_ACC=CAM_ASM_000251 /TAXON_ID=180227 /ORGANISM="Neoparamoeba aestuarina, Strain SoJaBio B1-5/56/2" /LENGTH=619 /DNA_ID=CAMNT_0047907493 /DNA_START=210 /DNA_END=2072 /DNA_ORIENTATION=+
MDTKNSMVDSVILTTLRGISCPIDEDIKTVDDLSPKMILLSVSRCLNLLDDSLNYPTETVPRQMASAVSLATKVCASIKGFGYRGQIGYHQLLYASPVENRKLLSWLITQLPSNESEEALDGESSLDLSKEILHNVTNELKKPWMLPTTTKYKLGVESEALHETKFKATFLQWPTCGTAPRVDFKVIEDYIRFYSKPIVSQPPTPTKLAASLIETSSISSTATADWESEWNSVGLESGLNPFDYRKKKNEKIKGMTKGVFGSFSASVSSFKVRHNLHRDYLAREEMLKKRTAGKLGTRFTHQKMFSKESDKKKNAEELEKEKQEAREMALNQADEKLNKRQAKVDQVLKQIADMKTNIAQMEPQISQEAEKTQKLKQTLLNLKKTNELLPDAAANITKLQQISEKNTQNLMELAIEWEKFRAPLVAELRSKSGDIEGKRKKTLQQTKEIREMRREIKEIQAEIDQQVEQAEKMSEVFGSMKTTHTREFFTSHIDEIIRQVRKQQVDIDNILGDTKALKKERNATSETLNRSFAVTSDLLFKDAKKGDMMAKKAFRILVSLHKNYERLGEIVEETGTSSNSSSTLSNKTIVLEKKTKTMDLEGLEKDLADIRAENKRLQK